MKKNLITLLNTAASFSACAVGSYPIEQRDTFSSFGIKHLEFSIQSGRFFNHTSDKAFKSATGSRVDVTIDATWSSLRYES
jgi:polyisoprenoid-binding protein YceI